MAETELEGGVGDIGVRLNNQAFARGVQAHIAQQVHGGEAMDLVAQRMGGAHADAGRVCEAGQRQRCAQTRFDIFLELGQALPLAGADLDFGGFFGQPMQATPGADPKPGANCDNGNCTAPRSK